MVKRLAGVVLAICFAVGVAYGGVSGYQDLTRFLVNLPGWTAGGPEGVNMEGPQGKVVTATRSYKRGNQSLTATIMVGNSAMMAWAPFQMGMTVETPEVLIKTISYKGLKAGINYDKKEKGGGIVVQLSTQNPTAAFVINFEAMDYNEALKLLDHFDVKGMASAVK
ncbi:MAG: hypothetical protein DRI91_02085 [Aquificota bacterium]|nr:MAG: hypothetical protein DRI91_02085 [Aquificota bacterium]